MDPQMKVTMFLADHADAVNGKLYINGGGWSQTSADVPFGIAIDIKVPWQLTNKLHELRLELIDSEGRPVVLEGGEGDGDAHASEPVVLALPPFEVGRPAGLVAGTPIDQAFAVNCTSGLPLAPGRYEWRLTVNGEAHESWALGFTVRARPPQAMAA
jgi:hypothetical protein